LFVKLILVYSSEAFVPVYAYYQGKAISVVTKWPGHHLQIIPVWSVYYLWWCINWREPHLTLKSQADFEVLALGWKGSITQFCGCEEQLQDLNRLNNHRVLWYHLHPFLVLQNSGKMTQTFA